MSGAGSSTVGFSWSGGSNGQNVVNPLSAIAPSDILSIDVLKDASAADTAEVEARLAANQSRLDALESRYRVYLDGHGLWPVDGEHTEK